MIEQLSLDARIDQQHAALERGEQDALAIAAKLRAIPGAEGLLKRKRSYGELGGLNPWAAGHENMTAQGAIIRADRPFAAWLAHQAGKSIPPVDYEALAQQERLNASARAMESKVAELKQQRLERQQQQEWRRTHGFMKDGQWVV